MIKKLFILALVFIFILSSCVKQENKEKSETEAGITEKIVPTEAVYTPKNSIPLTVNMYELKNDSEKDAVLIGNGEQIGILFNATGMFDLLEFNCPSWSNDIGTLNMALYTWSIDYDSTVKNNPIIKQTYVDYSDNAWLTLECGKIFPGEYLAVLYDGIENVGIWRSKASTGYTTSFLNGSISESGDYMVRINYMETPEKELALPTYFLDTSVRITTPEEPVYSDDHPIKRLDAMSDTWTATDALGRTLPGFGDIGGVKKDKTRQVGLFYWTWHYNFVNCAPVNITMLMKEHPEAKNDFLNPVWKTDKSYQYFWDEPIFGYYDSRDKWVLRKHAELLADAGVDVVIFDCTNGTFTWRPSYMAVLETFAAARADGVNTPKVAFILPFGANDDMAVSLRQLYLDIYRTNKFHDLWYYWKGKPLIMASPDCLHKRDDISEEIKDFFTFRFGQPVYANGNTKDRWGWLSVYPQQIYRNDDGTPEQMAVGVAQNWNKAVGLTAMNGKDIFGRTYTSKGYDKREDAVLYGANFAEQFDYALETDPEFIFITGWNEWVAGRYETWGGPDGKDVTNAFPDEFDETFSRDIEPTKGFLKDNYYYQMVSYIRKYKGVRNLPEVSEKKTVDIYDNSYDWSDVLPVYRAYANNTNERNSGGYSGYHYEDKTGRNDIIEARVARDDNYLYFMALTNKLLTPSSDKNWMRLFIDIPDGKGPNWEGYEFVINKSNPSEKKAVIEKSLGGWVFEVIGEVEYSVSSNRLVIKVPKEMIGVEGDKFTVNFKWNDNMQTDGDIMDFYTHGDTAPGGRFNYSYTVK